MAYTTINKPNTHFNTVLWNGDNADNRSITGVGFQPDFVWQKTRNQNYSHSVYDVIRGVTNRQVTNDTAADQTYLDFKSFDSDGFTIDEDALHLNQTGDTNVAWNWKAGGTAVSNTAGSITSSVSANTTSGFSVVSFTGTGSVATVGHGLDAVPKMFIIKRRNSTGGWITYHSGYSAGATAYINLNATTQYTDSGMFNNTPPTSSVFTIGTGTSTNENGGTYIAYAFADVKGFSKFGSYAGNSSTDGTFVYTGFKPAFLLIKNISAVQSWWMWDNKRIGYNGGGNHRLRPNDGSAEFADATSKVDLLSNGFKFRDGDNAYNFSGNNFIYMAFAENPLVGTNGIPATAR